MIRNGKSSDIKACVKLHKKNLAEGIFSQLDPNLLEKVYAYAIADKSSFLLLDFADGKINGAALGSEDISTFLKSIRKRYFFPLLANIAWILFRHPSYLTTLVQPYAKHATSELLFLYADAKGRGTGRNLVHASDNEFKKRDIQQYRVELSSQNKGAFKFYQKQRFQTLKKADRIIMIKRLL